MITSREASKFPTRREYKVRMPLQLSSSWPFVWVHTKAAITKVIRLGRQNKTLWQRRAGFRSVELRKGLSDDDSDNWSRRVHTCVRTATAFCPFHGLSPVHISNTTQPTLQISILELYPILLATTSGAIQKTLPCIGVWALIMLMSSIFFEIPKSEILHSPNSSTKMLSVFKS